MKTRVKHCQVPMVFRTHGGKRKGAGRKSALKRAPHTSRPRHNWRHPVHVTIRVVGNVSSLRTQDLYLAVRDATIVTAMREDFRIVDMSVQRDHIHLIVESDHTAALSNGVRGFSISAAKRINRAIGRRTGERRTGKVIADRFHARPLTSPRAVRNAISYVLNNWRHHGEDRDPATRTWKVDRFSSGVSFPDWKELEHSPFLFRPTKTYQPLVVYRPRTWLLAKGWQQHHPLISVREVPGHD